MTRVFSQRMHGGRGRLRGSKRSHRSRDLVQMYGGREPPNALELETDALRSVFLFTDGLANEGIQGVTELVSACSVMTLAGPSSVLRLKNIMCAPELDKLDLQTSPWHSVHAHACASAQHMP
jgi:hypothetical protein